MKKIYKALLFITGLTISCFTHATVHTVSVLSSSFSPQTVNAEVGDTVKWIHTGGTHTTTSTSVPVGAATWDSPINPNVTEFSYQVTVVGTYDYKCTPHGFTGQIIVTNTTGISTPDFSDGFNIYSTRPSVYNIAYSLTRSSEVKIAVYDLTGKSVMVLSSSLQNAGEHLNTFYMDELQNGIYLIEFIAGNHRFTKRIIIE